MEQVEGQAFLIADEVARMLDQATRTPDSAEQTTEIGVAHGHIAAEQEARFQQLEKLQTVLTNIPGIVYAIDRLGVITLLDGKGVESLGRSSGDTLITSMFDLYRGVPEALKNWRRALSGEAFTALNEVDGHVLESRFMPVRDQNDEVTSIICVAVDVTERSWAEKHRLAAETRLIAERKQAEEALRESQERLRTIVANTPLVLFALDAKGIITLSEGRGLQALGLKPEEVVGTSVFDLYRTIPEEIVQIRGVLEGRSLTSMRRINELAFETHYTPLFDSEGHPNGAIGVAIDITERVQAEETLRTQERRFRSMIEQASDLVLILDTAGVYQYVSPSHQRLIGYAPEALLGSNVFNLIHPDDRAQVQSKFASAFHAQEKVVQVECRVRHANSTWVTLDCVSRNCLDDPAVRGFIINARDVSERRAMEETLRHQALHDSLTDLPNRTLLQERLEQALHNAQQQGCNPALLILDIDRFKDINDTFGYQHGDALLKQVATRLRQALSGAETVARLGGDEFAILLPTADETCMYHVALTLHKALEAPCCVAGNPLQIEASIGGAHYPVHGTDPLTLMRRADVAIDNAKHMHERYMLYDAAHDDQGSSRRIALVGALRQAIAADELMLYYQPKVDLKTGAAYSTEALARWQHPTFGFVPPDQFISLAEQTGLIAPLTQWVLATAIKQCSSWLRNGLDLNIAVNLSMWNLRDARLPEIVAALLEKYSVPPRLLRVELTESAVMTDTERALDVLQRLSTLGVRISIDDFGTGYSSLAYLKRLPVDELKIDRSFVQHLSEVESDATIVRSMITLAHGLGLHVVAEGVEDQATWQILHTLKCDTAQGYYMSRPLPAQSLEDWLRNTQSHTKKSPCRG